MPDLAPLGLDIQSEKVVEAFQNLDKMVESAGKAETATEKLDATTKALGQAMGGNVTVFNVFNNSVNNYAAAAEKVVQATTATGMASKTATEAVKAHGGTIAEAEKILKGHTAAVNDNEKAIGLNRIQMMEATHVARSLFDQIAAGQSPFRALALEAGRIQTFFQLGTGTIGEQVGGLVGSITKLINPVTLVGGALAAMGVAATLAFSSFEKGQDTAARALNGIGQRTGNTVADLNGMAYMSASRGGFSNAESLRLTSGFAAAGIGGSTNQALVGDTKAYARMTGSGLEDAGAELAKIFADPARGAKELDDRLGLLDGRLERTIETYTAQGNLDAARMALESRLHDALSETVDTTWTFTRALSAAANVASNLFTGVGGTIASILHLNSESSKLANLQQTQGYLQGMPSSPTRDAELARVQTQIASLQAKLGAQEQQAAQRKEVQDDRQQSLRADAIVKAILPELSRRETTENQLSVLRSALSDPGVLDRMGARPGEVQKAYSNLSIQAANADPAQRQKQDYDLAMASANAFTLAERAAVDARRAELAVLRETGDLTRARAASQEAVNLAIAKANSDADDSLAKARQQASYVGMTPYGRGRQQIIDKFEGDSGLIAKASASPSELSDAMRPVASDLKTAGDELAEALKEAAQKVKSAVPFLSVDGKPMASPYGSLGGFTGDPAAAIKSIESSGNYGALGPITKTGDRAYGAYQVMGANIPSWSRSALGYSMTPQQFVANPAAQDAVFNHQFGMSMSRYGNASDAASVWFTGRPLAQGANARDITGTSGSQYVDRFNARLGNPSALTVHGSGGMVAPIAATAAGSYKTQEGVELGAYDKQQQIGPTTQAEQQIRELNTALKAQTETYGMSADKIARASFEQNLFNQYAREGVTPTDETKKKIAELADQYQNVTKRASDFQAAQARVSEAVDGVRNSAQGGLSTVLNDLANGKHLGDSFKDALVGIRSEVLNLASKSIVNSLFGMSGQSGGGAFGGGLTSLFGSLFSGGSSTGLFGGLFGSASGGGGSLGVGHNASGTDDWQGGPTWVGERGPEVINLPRGAEVTPASQSMGDGSIDVHYHDMVGTKPTVTQSRGPDGKRQIQVMVEQAMARSAQTNGPGYRAAAARGSFGRTGGG